MSHSIPNKNTENVFCVGAKKRPSWEQSVKIFWSHSPYHNLDLVVLHGVESNTGHRELRDELLHIVLELLDLGTVLDCCLEVLEQLARGGLELQGNLHSAVQKVSDLSEVLLLEPAGGEGGGADADTARGECGLVAQNCVLVERDGAVVANGLHLGARKALGLEIPQHEVIDGTAGGKGVAVLVGELVSESLGVLANLLGVLLEGRSGHLLELSGDTSNLVHVGAALQTREDGGVDLGLEVAGILLHEDKAGTRTAHRLVARRGNHIGILERVGSAARGNKARDVSHVHQEQGTAVVSNLAKFDVVPLAGVCRSTANDHCGLEQVSLGSKGFVVNQTRDGVDTVGERLKVH